MEEAISSPAPLALKSRNVVVTALLAVLLIGGGNVWLVMRSGAAEAGASPAGGERRSFELAALPPPVSATGLVQSRRVTRISPPVAGLVRRVVPERFTFVRAGETVVELDAQQAAQGLRQEEVGLDAAQLQIAQSKARADRSRSQEIVALQLRQAKDRLEHLRSNLAREKSLFAAGVTSAAAVEELAAGVRQQEVEVELLEKRAEASKDETAAADLERQMEVKVLEKRAEAGALAVARAREQVSQLTIKAPADGIVTEIYATPGQFVAPGGTGDQASTLLVMADLSDLFVQLSVDEIDVSRIKTGQEIELKVEALPQEKFRARVLRVATSPSVRPNKPGVSFEVEAELIEPSPLLRIGMSVSAVIPDGRPLARSLPESAVHQDASGAWVWVDDQKVLRRRMVKVGALEGDRFPLLAGLDEGAKVLYGEATALGSLVEGHPAPSAE